MDTTTPSPIRQFSDRWTAAYRSDLGAPYLHGGAKDTLAIKRLLAADPSVDNWMNLAQLAWKSRHKFWCRQSVTICGFASKVNEIRQELGMLKPAGKSNDW